MMGTTVAYQDLEKLGPFQKGIEGPGGWWILAEPEVHFVLDIDVAVPVSARVTLVEKPGDK